MLYAYIIANVLKLTDRKNDKLKMRISRRSFGKLCIN